MTILTPKQRPILNRIIADWIEGLKTPSWLKEFGDFFWSNVLIPTLKQIGNEALSQLEYLIIQAAKKDNMSNREKFVYVYNGIKDMGNFKELGDSSLNLLIETTFSQLKAKGIV